MHSFPEKHNFKKTVINDKIVGAFFMVCDLMKNVINDLIVGIFLSWAVFHLILPLRIFYRTKKLTSVRVVEILIY